MQRHYQSLLGGIRGPTHSSFSADAQQCGKASFMDQQTSQYSEKLAIASVYNFVYVTFQRLFFLWDTWERVTFRQLLKGDEQDPDTLIPRATLERRESSLASILHLAVATPPLAAARPMTVPRGVSCAVDVTPIPENTAGRSWR